MTWYHFLSNHFVHHYSSYLLYKDFFIHGFKIYTDLYTGKVAKDISGLSKTAYSTV